MADCRTVKIWNYCNCERELSLSSVMQKSDCCANRNVLV